MASRRQRWGLQIIMMLAASAFASSVHAEFTMNFQVDYDNRVPNGDQSSGAISCNYPGVPDSDCDRIWHTDTKFDPDPTPFIQELVINAAGTQAYYHVIVGDRSTGFVTEYYIETQSSSRWPNGYAASQSGGGYNGGIDASPVESPQWGIYFHSPLHKDPRFSGNATGRPDRVIFRQIIEDAEMFQETHKATFGNKPKIEQVITQSLPAGTNPIDAKFKTYFLADMSNLSYGLNNANFNAGSGVVIEQWVYDDENPQLLLDGFKLAEDGQIYNANAGKFTYNYLGSPWGSYNYNGGRFNHLNVDWAKYRDPLANVPDNPLPGYPGYVAPQ